MPLALDGLVVSFSEGPLILIRIPFTALPFWRTLIESTVVRPTKSGFEGALTAVQNTAGGMNGPLTLTELVAVLLAVFVSASFATVVTVFVTVIAEVAVVTSVIVTDAPTFRFPSWQLTIAPPVHVPCEVATETNVVPAGTGSDAVTPVALFGPLFVTTIVQVTGLPTVAGFGAPVLVIWTSTFGAGGAGGAGGGGGGGAALVFVSVQVTVAPASSTTDPSARQPVMLVRLYPETAPSVTLYVPGRTRYVVPEREPGAGLFGSSSPAVVTWIVKSPGPFVPPPLLLSTTFLTIRVASFVFVKVQVTFSPSVRPLSEMLVPASDCDRSLLLLQLHVLE